MRIWIDLSAPAHPVVFRPLVQRLRAAGHEVEVTARDFAQTLELAQLAGIDALPVGAHGGRSAGGKLRSLTERSTALWRWARSRPRFDLAAAHGSNDLPIVARVLRIPAVDLFDYEWATLQHQVNCRLARAVVVPDAIPAERLRRYGATGKLHRYPGLKEEYYLADFEPDPAVLDELALDASAPLAVVRTPPAVSLYHRFENALFAAVLERLRGQQTVVLPRTPEQEAELRAAGGFIVPEVAIDAQSLIAFADVVISAGGTMNREAAALGTPVYTVFEGRRGAVDERLLDEGRLRRLASADQVVVRKRPEADRPARVRRDPGLLADLLLSPVTDGAGA